MTKPLPIEIRLTTSNFTEQLERLQAVCYPTLTSDELLNREKYAHHLQLFPDGQFMAVLKHPQGEYVVGSCASIRYNFDFNNFQHKFTDITDNGWLNTHNPNGEWLYGLDMCVHPDFRRRHIASRLYVVRSNIVKRLNLRGEAVGGMIPGYEAYRKTHTQEAYVADVAKGKLIDPTLTPQLKQGFRVVGVLYNYLTDPRSDDCGAFMVRENPNYIETSLDDLPSNFIPTPTYLPQMEKPAGGFIPKLEPPTPPVIRRGI
jgi:ribosomal protein S18 acetylase RimI-like enzyme